MRIVFSIVLILATVAVDSAKWIEVPPLESNSSERNCANRSKYAWRVSSSGGRLVIDQTDERNNWEELPGFIKPKSRRQRKQLATSLSALKVNGGYLIGADNGEWGGSVSWRSDVGDSGYEISKGNPQAMVRTSDGVFVVDGLSHLTTDEGAVYRMETNPEGRWEVRARFPLPAAGWAATVTPDGRVVVVTTTGLVEIREASAHSIAAVDFSLLYPNSVVEIDGTIYVGMRYAVAKLMPTDGGYSESWIAPLSCQNPCGCKRD